MCLDKKGKWGDDGARVQHSSNHLGKTGMGRRSYSDRKTVEDCRIVSVSHLAQAGIFNGVEQEIIMWKRGKFGTVGALGLQVIRESDPMTVSFIHWLKVGHGMREVSFSYEVRIVSTPCNFGGRRHWFLCPQRDCGRRVRILYQPPFADRFGCRQCFDLTYQTCRESHGWIENHLLQKAMTFGQYRRVVRSVDY